MIDLFKEKYAFLSNFYPGEILYKGVIFPTLENVYQAAKYDGEDAATVYQEFAQITPGKAKRKGSKLSCRTDWDKIKLQVMEKLLRLKFAQPYFKELLLATGEQELIEGNYWHDRVCYEDGTGVEQDISEAMDWYKKAAEQGFAEAQFNLGRCYEDEGDFYKAADWYQEAADQGLEIAKIYLHICCR